METMSTVYRPVETRNVDSQNIDKEILAFISYSLNDLRLTLLAVSNAANEMGRVL
jgi:hypothetical protein